jgi:alkylated DNA repair protein (DNA oxidative demethylase)
MNFSFENLGSVEELLPSGMILLRGYVLSKIDIIYSLLKEIETANPFRQMLTPRGFKMSVAMTSCGSYGWVTDKKGYRYTSIDPLNKKTWMNIPKELLDIATSTAALAGYQNFIPDSCLINRYETGSKLSLHQDKGESDLSHPVVSISLGLPATFLIGGLERADKTRRLVLSEGDVLVFGGESRLLYHGIMPLKKGLSGKVDYRFNFTFRKAGV